MARALVVTIALAVTLAGGRVSAQDNVSRGAESSQPPPRGVAVVDLGRVFAHHPGAKEFTAALRKKANLLDRQMARWQKEVVEYREYLERHDPRGRNSEEDLEKAIIDRQRALEDGKCAVDRLLDKASAPRFAELCDEITAAAKAYAESEGFATLFGYGAPSDVRGLLAIASTDQNTKRIDRSGIVLLYAHPSCDITDGLIARLNHIEKKELPKKTNSAK